MSHPWAGQALYGKLWNRARNRAMARLRDRYRQEYDDLMHEELRKEGLPRRPLTADEELRRDYGV